MATTQFDLLRDDLIDLLKSSDLTIAFNDTNNHEGDNTEVPVDEDQAKELAELMIDMLTDEGVQDYNATENQIKNHFRKNHGFDMKTVSTDYGDIVPGEISKESVIL